jgi:hypothetical protein
MTIGEGKRVIASTTEEAGKKCKMEKVEVRIKKSVLQ